MLGGFVAACMLATSTITIEPGDTLSEIGREYRVSVVDLVAWNDLEDPGLIIAGETLLLVPPAEEAGVAAGAGSADRPDSYTIAPGDTLSAIAVRFGISAARLVKANDLDDPDRIVAGTTLELSGHESGRNPTVSPAAGASHTVVAGDTLSAIAAILGVSTTTLARTNGLANPDLIRVGQVLERNVEGDRHILRAHVRDRHRHGGHVSLLHRSGADRRHREIGEG